MSFVEAAKIRGKPHGTKQHAKAGGAELCITYNVGMFFVIGDRCDHMNTRLSTGDLQENILSCTFPLSRSDTATGKKVPGPEKVCRPCLTKGVF